MGQFYFFALLSASPFSFARIKNQAKFWLFGVSMQKPRVFGITGVSCAGKTTLCNAICASSQSRVVAVVSQDNFYKVFG